MSHTIEINEYEQRRGANLIWNAAGDYDIFPEFIAYDEYGRAELYWNSIIGLTHLRFDYEMLSSFIQTFAAQVKGFYCENLLWLSLEDVVYHSFEADRPALPLLRQLYAQSVLRIPGSGDERLDSLMKYHFGSDEELSSRDRQMMGELAFATDITTEEAIERATAIFTEYLGYDKDRKNRYFSNPLMSLIKLWGSEHEDMKDHIHIKGFAFGFGEHLKKHGDSSAMHKASLMPSRPTNDKELDLRAFMADYFGMSIYDIQMAENLERRLCVGHHEGCHLHITRGIDDGKKVRGYAGEQRKVATAQHRANLAHYHAHLSQNHMTISRMTDRLRNSMLTRLDISIIKSATGSLVPSRLWRATHLRDTKVFEKKILGDTGDIAIMILIDSSMSQEDRQEILATQGYILAESLTRCRIPVCVTSFCSMNGYTVLNIFRDFHDTQANDSIFGFFAAGCNRDGLGLLVAADHFSSISCEHKLLVILSDAQPHDVMKLNSSVTTDYADEAAIDDTASCVHQVRLGGVSVACIFTGTDEAVPVASRIYGKDFVRIKSLEYFADAVIGLLERFI